MKTTNTAASIYAIQDIVDQADKLRNAYFFQPPQNASGRRSYEAYNSRPEIAWTEGGRHYTAAIDVQCSCANVYVTTTYTRDGKKTTLTAVKNSLRRLQAAQEITA